MTKKIFRNSLTLALVVAIVVTILMPTTSWAQTIELAESPNSVYSVYPELTPEMQKYIEDFYWEIILGRVHINPKYYEKKSVDSFNLRDEVQIVAQIILEEMEPYPAGEPGDTSALQWQRHWDDFFWNIASGNFSNKKLLHHLRRVRRKARRYKVKFW